MTRTFPNATLIQLMPSAYPVSARSPRNPSEISVYNSPTAPSPSPPSPIATQIPRDGISSSSSQFPHPCTQTYPDAPAAPATQLPLRTLSAAVANDTRALRPLLQSAPTPATNSRPSPPPPNPICTPRPRAPQFPQNRTSRPRATSEIPRGLPHAPAPGHQSTPYSISPAPSIPPTFATASA